MKLLPKQLKKNQEALRSNYFYVARDGDGQLEMDQGHCELTGLWTNTRVTILSEKYGELLIEFQFAVLIEDGEDVFEAIEKELTENV